MRIEDYTLGKGMPYLGFDSPYNRYYPREKQ